MATTPPVPDPLALTNDVFAAVAACAGATSFAIGLAVEAAANSRLDTAGAMAATAQQAARATKDLCDALVSLQGPGPLRAVAGTPPPMYPPVP